MARDFSVGLAWALACGAPEELPLVQVEQHFRQALSSLSMKQQTKSVSWGHNWNKSKLTKLWLTKAQAQEKQAMDT